MKPLPALIGLVSFTLVGLLSCNSPSTSSDLDQGLPAKIQAVEQGLRPAFYYRDQQQGFALQDRMRYYKVPGVSVAVIEGGELAWARGYGLRSADGSEAVDAETLFQAASISKPVAVMGVMRLVEEGILDLDEDVNQRLTTWKVPSNQWTEQSPVTLRAIMSHTAGFTVHGFPGYVPGQPLPSVPQILDGEPPANTPPVRVDKLPGEGFRYSGGGITVMQQLVMDVTRLPFPEFMSSRVLEPLGMTRSIYQQPLPAEWASNAARAHDEHGKVVQGGWHVYPEMAAAGLWTTPSDLARAAIEVQKALAGKGGKILQQQTVQQMLTPQNGGPYGLGFALEGEGKNRRFSHGGSNRGFRCILVAYAERGQGAAVMTNASQGPALFGEILQSIARVYEWPDYPQIAVEVVRLGADVLDRFTGTFEDPSGNRYTFSRQEDHLLGSRSDTRGPFVLWAVSENEFIMEQSRTPIRFELQGGRAEKMVIRPGEGEVRAVRVQD